MEPTPADAAAEPLAANPVLTAAADAVISVRGADVGTNRERLRRRRLWKLAVVLGVPAGWMWWRWLEGRPVDLSLPHIDPFFALIFVFFGLMIVLMLGQFVFARRSPHLVFRPEQIDVRMSDVVGIAMVKEEVIRSLNLFLAHKTFAGQMGGTPRRGLLFEGAPGTGKTYLAKAMAAEAGVPFLFVSATSFQSMWYGATAGKIKSYFKAVRKAARAEGGAIAFIEEIDAIATTRGGMQPMTAADPTRMVSCCGGLAALPATYLTAGAPGGLVHNRVAVEGVGGVVNELLVQLQSFDDPTGMQKLYSRLVESVNLLLPLDRQIPKPKPQPANVLVIAATNRADSLDPALLRPGRFDRRLTFELPDQRGRRELIDHFLARKAHHDEVDEERREALAGITHGYSPVMIEHLFDEALVNAVRRGDTAMTWADVERARLTEEIGLGQPVGYTEHEKRLIATHESGHATAAYLVAPQRRLEVLSIIKRREALGLLAHGDAAEVFTRSRAEMLSLVQIALAGQCAEEIFFGDVSTGPGGDLLYATNVAAQMVGASGMTSTLISYAAVQNSAFNDTNIVGRVLADPDGRKRVEDLLQDQKLRIKAELEANAHLVAALRDELLERSELIGKEIRGVLDRARDEAARTAEPAPVALAPAAATVIDLREPVRHPGVVNSSEQKPAE